MSVISRDERRPSSLRLAVMWSLSALKEEEATDAEGVLVTNAESATPPGPNDQSDTDGSQCQPDLTDSKISAVAAAEIPSCAASSPTNRRRRLAFFCVTTARRTRSRASRGALVLFICNSASRAWRFFLALLDDAAENRAINHAVSAMTAASILEGGGDWKSIGKSRFASISTPRRERWRLRGLRESGREFEAEVALDAAHMGDND